MKVINKVGVTRAPFDIPEGMAEILLHLHLVDKAAAPAAKILNANTRWLVEPEGKTATGERIAPYVRAKCACGANCDRFGGPKPENLSIRHLPGCTGGVEVCPADVCADYLEHRRMFYPAQGIVNKVVGKLEQVRADLRAGIVRVD